MNERVSKTEELGRRAVACKGWRWMPGMLLLWKLHERGGTYCGRVCHLETSDSGTAQDVYCEGRGDHFDGALEVPNCFPDLSDPATLGCLLHLVRQAQPDQVRWVMSSCCSAYGRWYTNPSRGGARDYDTEAEALVAALEAAR
jgi:hypothetical protein